MVNVHLVVTRRNRAELIPWNLPTVLNQSYPNLRVTYIDDCSDDDSETVTRRVAALGAAPPVNYIFNKARRGVIANILSALADDTSDTVAVLLDGDDALATPRAIERIAAEYDDSEAWLTYGHFLSWPEFGVIYEGAYDPACVRGNHFRSWFWRCAPPRSFRVGLLRAVPRQYHLDQDGSHWELANDQGLLLPMLELAGSHIRHIPDILYLYDVWNWRAPSPEQSVLLAGFVERIRSLPPLSPLNERPW